MLTLSQREVIAKGLIKLGLGPDGKRYYWGSPVELHTGCGGEVSSYGGGGGWPPSHRCSKCGPLLGRFETESARVGLHFSLTFQDEAQLDKFLFTVAMPALLKKGCIFTLADHSYAVRVPGHTLFGSSTFSEIMYQALRLIGKDLP